MLGLPSLRNCEKNKLGNRTMYRSGLPRSQVGRGREKSDVQCVYIAAQTHGTKGFHRKSRCCQARPGRISKAVTFPYDNFVRLCVERLGVWEAGHAKLRNTRPTLEFTKFFSLFALNFFTLSFLNEKERENEESEIKSNGERNRRYVLNCRYPKASWFAI